jgi:hypothetical protein
MLLFPSTDRLGQPPGRHLPRLGMGAHPVVEVQAGVMLALLAGEEAHPAEMLWLGLRWAISSRAETGKIEG